MSDAKEFFAAVRSRAVTIGRDVYAVVADGAHLRRVTSMGLDPITSSIWARLPPNGLTICGLKLVFDATTPENTLELREPTTGALLGSVKIDPDA